MRKAILSSALLTFVFGTDIGRARAQLTQDQMADMVLAAARQSYNEKQLTFAALKFRDFLGRFPQHKEASAARYGLALTLLDTPGSNLAEARDLLQHVSGNKEAPDHPFILYHLGLVIRAQGLQELKLADANPNAAPAHRANAQKRFAEALPRFADALAQFGGRIKDLSKDAKELPADAEWAARARCDLAEMHLRLFKTKEAQTASAPFVKDPVLSRSRYRDQGRYYYGFAAFLLRDYAQAQQTLSMLAPFHQPDFGPHGRYLLARTHHFADEKAEAALHYEAAVDDYQKSKAQAALHLKTPQKVPDPVERARLEALLKDPVPDHVGRSNFYLGVLLYEGGKFADAKGRFLGFVKLYPQSPLRVEAELRVGFCQVQLREFAEAARTLIPLIDKDARVSDQVLFWLGKAQAGAAPDPTANQAGHVQALNAAVATFRQAQDRAQRLEDQDLEAKGRRALILLEIADTLQQLKQPREAANVYNQLLNEKLLPERDEELGQRLVFALHLAGDYVESDKQCTRFLDKHPKSPLAPAVLFCQAENSYFRALAAEKNPNQAERAKEAARLGEETIKRFTQVVEGYPEFPKINLARYSLGLTCYKQGNLDAARKAFETIPGPERAGELALVPYLMADCLLRQAPTTVPEDALAAGKLEEQLKSAAELLDAFIGGQQGSPQLADALLKYGLCQQRLAGLLAQPPEKAKALAAARATYEKMFAKQFTNQPQVPQAHLERAKVIAQTGDVNTAINELRRFTNDPLRNAAVAPMALIQMATLLRSQNKAPEAADVLAKAREQHEAKLAADPERAGWVALLRYHHGVALREAGKFPEARQVFDAVVKTASTRPEGIEAALRLGQCLKEEGTLRLEASRKLPGNPKEAAQVQRLSQEGYQLIRDSVSFLQGQADQLKKSDAAQEIRARMLYEAAWGTRILAEPEVKIARGAIALEMLKKLGPQASKFGPPEVAIEKVPLQPSEKKAHALYAMLIEGFPDLPLSSEARFELAELLARRNEHEPAVKLLTEALDKEPTPELTEKVRLRLGSIHASKGNLKAALAQFDAVAQNPKSPLIGWAHYRAGEALIKNQQYSDAIKRLVVFRDQPPLQNQPGLTDRALLRLGHAFALVKDWDSSRQALERLVNAFPASSWSEEARYGIGWALQQQNNHEAAVNMYSQVTARTAREIAAKAQFQIGLCRLEQKRFVDAVNALLVVPFTYDYPELSAAALLEAARAYQEGNQKDQALRMLQRVIRDYPDTPFAEAAKERLAAKKLN
jgi:TolA-binding protein